MSSTSAHEPVKVLYIMGAGRSGSTLLSNLLGEMSNFVSVGELRYLWELGLGGDALCGCGRELVGCPFWGGVVTRQVGGRRLSDVRPGEMVRALDKSVRMRHLPRLFITRDTSSWPALRVAVDTMELAYQAVALETGARVVVDASKRPTGAAHLRFMQQVDPYVVHLVRDPRAVMHSWRRRKDDPGRRGPHALEPEPWWRALAHWSLRNIGSELVGKQLGSKRTLIVRYEEFVSSPVTVLGRLAQLVGEASEPPAMDANQRLGLSVHHTAWGNPVRMSDGIVHVRADDAWLDELRPRDALWASLIAGPLLRRYEYPLWPRT